MPPPPPPPGDPSPASLRKALGRPATAMDAGTPPLAALAAAAGNGGGGSGSGNGSPTSGGTGSPHSPGSASGGGGGAGAGVGAGTDPWALCGFGGQWRRRLLLGEADLMQWVRSHLLHDDKGCPLLRPGERRPPREGE